jgi:hypothetical protein
MARRCVYTVLYGQYDCLPPQEVQERSGLPFIAFVDPESPPREVHGWTLRWLPPRLRGDPVRSARFVKLHPHLLLPEFEESLYIDCTVRLRVPPEAVFEAMLEGQARAMACCAHSHRTSVLDEVRAVIALGYDDPGVIRRQLEAYAAQGLGGTGPLVWSGMQVRRHHDPELVRFNTLWWEQVLRFSRRDQISFPFLAEQEGFEVTAHPIDNEESVLHCWPVPRTRARSPWRGEAASGHLATLIAEVARAARVMPAELVRLHTDVADAQPLKIKAGSQIS